MFRKTILALTAIAALGTVALAPTAADAKKMHGKHIHGLSLGYVAYDDCYQYRLVETRRGLRWRMVNVCW